MTTGLPGTPFHARTAPLCQARNWRRWAGFIVASSYELHHDREYHAIRSSAALFDVSPLFKYAVRGRDATRLLDRVVTRNVGAAKVGQVLYTPWCDGDGKALDDGTVARLAENELRVTSADPNYRWLQTNARGLQVEIDDVSDSIAALALQGPAARRILEAAIEADLAGLRFFRLTTAAIRGVPVQITRTGYTGDLGYEVWLSAAHALPVWDALVEVGIPFGLTPAGMLALDVARIEAGLVLLDVDYVSARKALIEDQKSSPLELSLDWTVAFDKPAFVGRQALVAERARAAAWRFMGVEVQWESLESLYTELGLAPKLPTTAWRTSVPLYAPDSDRQVGYATSGCWSPLLKRYLALAHLEAAHASEGTELAMEMTVEHRRRRAKARVARLPFFDPERKRA
ncbi:MAG TPA: aminomethyltransferase family protein [Gemmatimonadaceae bacterium]|nr:aminomethyltransferase family protein [Gemmatimonadaceae bacterium]